MTGNVQFSCQSRRLNLSRPPVAEARATRAFGGLFFVKGPCSGPPKKIAAIDTGSMLKKRVPVKYPCTLGDHTDDDMEEEDENPTLSGGLRRNSDGEEDRQSLRTDIDEEEGDQVECGQGQQQQEEENDEDSSDTKVRC